ncbi:MAG: folate-binding protein YgfZ [Rhodocyclaceae bacterium]|nr:folate-binding protein YgfZ [Rhodocyclaceae bacterium]
MSACLIALTHLLTPIRASGEDAATLLNNLLSNDVRQVSEDAGQWSSLNSPKGRMLANFPLWRQGDAFVFAAAADLAEALRKKLCMYILRSKVQFAVADDLALFAACGEEAAISAALRTAGLPPLPQSPVHCTRDAHGRVCLRLTASCVLISLPAAQAASCEAALNTAGLPAGTENDWQLALIRDRLPLICAATQEAFVAQMLGFELIGVSFTKGCYPGQEVIARAQHLGKVKRHLVSRTLEAPADIGSPLADGAQLVSLAAAPEGGFVALAVSTPLPAH